MLALFGFGYWAVERRDDGAMIGQVGFADFKRDMAPSIRACPKWAGCSRARRRGQGYRHRGGRGRPRLDRRGAKPARNRRDHRPRQCCVDPGRREMRLRRAGNRALSRRIDPAVQAAKPADSRARSEARATPAAVWQTRREPSRRDVSDSMRRQIWRGRGMLAARVRGFGGGLAGGSGGVAIAGRAGGWARAGLANKRPLKATIYSFHFQPLRARPKLDERASLMHPTARSKSLFMLNFIAFRSPSSPPDSSSPGWRAPPPGRRAGPCRYGSRRRSPRARATPRGSRLMHRAPVKMSAKATPIFCGSPSWARRSGP